MTKHVDVIAIDHSATQARGITEIRKALKHRAQRWERLLFGNADHPENNLHDLVQQLSTVNVDIRTLEIVAEGNPYAIDSLEVTPYDPSGAVAFAAALKARVTTIHASTKIYLSGCNTGLRDSTQVPVSDDIAQRVADATLATVYGARGYILGAHALGTEHVDKEYGEGGPCPGAKEADGSAVWRRCRPSRKAKEAAAAASKAAEAGPGGGPETGGAADIHPVELLIREGGFAPPPPATRFRAVAAARETNFAPLTRETDFRRAATARDSAFVPLTAQQMEQVFRDVARSPIRDVPPYRVAPDRVLVLPGAGGALQTIQVIANGAALRDQATYRAWPNSQGRKLLVRVDPRRPFELTPARAPR